MERHQLRPPLGLLQLASVCQEAGHEVDIADQRVTRFNLADWLGMIAAGDSDLVGVSACSTMRMHHARYIRALRKHYSGVIVVGGPAAQEKTVDFWLDAGADVAVIGEGERTLPELLNKMSAGTPVEGVAGTAWRNAEHRTVLGPARPQLTVEEIENLPYAAWSQERTWTYLDSTVVTVRRPSVSVIATRGCPQRCAFCGAPKVGMASDNARWKA